MARVNVLSAAAVRRAVTERAADFERERGTHVALTFSTGPIIREAVMAGEAGADVVIGPEALMEQLAGEKRTDAGTARVIGGVKAGAAVCRGAAHPDLSSDDAVRAVLRRASAIVFNTASSGQFIDEMIKGLGVAQEVESKIRRFPDGADAMAFLARDATGTAVGFGQTTGLAVHEHLGIEVVGPLPDSIGKLTAYVGAVAADASNVDGARQFLDSLSDAQGRERLAATGVILI